LSGRGINEKKNRKRRRYRSCRSLYKGTKQMKKKVKIWHAESNPEKKKAKYFYSGMKKKNGERR